MNTIERIAKLKQDHDKETAKLRKAGEAEINEVHTKLKSMIANMQACFGDYTNPLEVSHPGRRSDLKDQIINILSTNINERKGRAAILKAIPALGNTVDNCINRCVERKENINGFIIVEVHPDTDCYRSFIKKAV